MKTIHHTTRPLYALILAYVTAIMAISCGVQKPPVTEHQIIYEYRDSVIVNKVDSTVIVPVEKVVDVVANYDTLKLETSLAKAEAYVDTTLHILRGKIENKSTFTQQIKYVDKIEYRDSIVYEKVPEPYPVEKVVKPKSYPYLLCWFIFSIVAIILLILSKFKII